jgi:hypothetical protein
LDGVPYPERYINNIAFIASHNAFGSWQFHRTPFYGYYPLKGGLCKSIEAQNAETNYK